MFARVTGRSGRDGDVGGCVLSAGIEDEDGEQGRREEQFEQKEREGHAQRPDCSCFCWKLLLSHAHKLLLAARIT